MRRDAVVLQGFLLTSEALVQVLPALLLGPSLASLSQPTKQQAGERIKPEMSGVGKNSRREAHGEHRASTLKTSYLCSGLFPSPGPHTDA